MMPDRGRDLIEASERAMQQSRFLLATTRARLQDQSGPVARSLFPVAVQQDPPLQGQ